MGLGKNVQRAYTDRFQDVTVTNDGATILSLLDVEHPAGKILVDLAQQQDKEVWTKIGLRFIGADSILGW